MDAAHESVAHPSVPETGRVRAQSLQGLRAGFVSRLAANTVDVIVVVAIQFGLILLAAVVRYLFTRNFKMPDLPPLVSVGIFCVISMIYLSSGWSTTGKTLGKQIVGVRVVRANGGRLHLRKALARAFAYVVFPAGLVFALVSRRDASLQDLALRTVVVYDWANRGLDAPVGD